MLSGTIRVTRSGRKPGHPGAVGGGAAAAVPAFRGGQQFAERALPARAQRGDVQGQAELGDVVAGQVEQRVGIGDAELSRPGPGLDDLIPRLDAAFGDHAQVEAGPVVADQERGHGGLSEAQSDPVAGDPGLGDLELRLADPVPIADAHLVVGEAVDGEVLPELAVDEIVPAEIPLPVLVRLDLVDEHRAHLAAVPVGVALTVAVDIQPPHHPRPRHRFLPDPRVDGPALPGHILRHTDIHRQDRRHAKSSFQSGVLGHRSGSSPGAVLGILAIHSHPARSRRVDHVRDHPRQRQLANRHDRVGELRPVSAASTRRRWPARRRIHPSQLTVWADTGPEAAIYNFPR